MDLAGRSLKGQLKHAQRLGARVVSVIGADEWARGVALLRDDEVPLDRLVDDVIELLMTDTDGQ
jgi:histidyl-tRNA synthetase